jgi:squalene-hopene/tetraprenyl-beta-curcumene cyclase
LEDPRLARAADWLMETQQSSGGWGETAGSYDDPKLRGRGPETASQTAWAVLGLVAAGRADSFAAQGGVEFLLTTQQPDGSWMETEFTGTGFPRVFYLRYHYYRIYFPLMALARYRAALERA